MEGQARLWVWGDTENDWVVQTDVSPSWSGLAGWLDSHTGGEELGGDGPQPPAEITLGPNGESWPNDFLQRVSVETFFPARANSWYLGWMWSTVFAKRDGGSFAGSGAYGDLYIDNVPLIVFGSLF